MITYDCPNDGRPKRERRQHVRPDRDQLAEKLFNGFSNVIENLDGNPYLQGYVKAMRESFAGFQRAQADRFEALDTEPTKPVKLLDGSVHQFTLRVAGKPYRCACGCNVFHKPDDRNLNLYQCNSCEEQFEAE